MSKYTAVILALIVAVCLFSTAQSAVCTYGGGSCLGVYSVCCNRVNPGRCCPTGYFCCGAEVNFGCCPTGYRCGLTTCTRIARSGNGPVSVDKATGKTSR